MEPESILQKTNPVTETAYCSDKLPDESLDNPVTETTCSSDKLSNESLNSDSVRKGKTGRKLYSCSDCGKRFGYSSKLSEHRRVHTGEKAFLCSICGKSFTSSFNLSQHESIHTGERTFTCNVCGKVFVSQSNFMRHKKVHTGEKPFSCSQCEKSFLQKSQLVAHMRLHTGERPFTCGVCGKSFRSSSNLSGHEKIHTGERPFVCDFCGLQFNKKSILVTHKKIHAAKNPPPPCDRTESSNKDDVLSQQKSTPDGEQIILVNDSLSSDIPQCQKNKTKTIHDDIEISSKESSGDSSAEKEIDPLEKLEIKVEGDSSKKLSVYKEINPLGDSVKGDTKPLEEVFVKEEGNPL